MNVYQIEVVCAACKTQNQLLLMDSSKSPSCDECGEQLFSFHKFKGCVYILKNKKVEGVKIGMTTGDVFARAKQISGTGVPGNFEVVAAFHSRNPAKDEKKVHERLSRHRLAKEHFKLDVVKAVVKTRTALNKDWVYLKPQYHRDVMDLIERQRHAAARKFQNKPEPSSQDIIQQDFFDGLSPIEIHKERKPAKSRGGVFSFLFD